MRFTLNCWLIPLGVIGAALSASSPATAQLTAIEGKPRVIDGDNIEIGDERIRLEGIDTPERWQTCRYERGSEYRAAARTPPTRCGASLATPRCVASSNLATTATAAWSASASPPAVPTSTAGLVKEGLALAYQEYSRCYVLEEKAARARGVGMHRGEFIPPWDWRRGKRLTQ